MNSVFTRLPDTQKLEGRQKMKSSSVSYRGGLLSSQSDPSPLSTEILSCAYFMSLAMLLVTQRTIRKAHSKYFMLGVSNCFEKKNVKKNFLVPFSEGILRVVAFLMPFEPAAHYKRRT